ncbi:N-acetylglucosamine kinase [Microbacterium sp. ASV49]|uniref:BadF/BadG/BcrA/BcrD ATPase family protein n=1 Tax=Microbacterium candidum TaxID=3041922 RepID=A0ABT7MXV5_9MICO|nr:BadF/BadG/BcrA/BcrD ATPase family protein [Microbacterium sp. ASV49]MDL9979284.1 BadF/BadG/BcrA/BcrD ATPase family protein [Microbacterium sp. ASV49]
MVVAIDGGGSKTDAVALTLAGEVVARARAGGSSPQNLGIEGALGVLDGLMADLLGRLPEMRVVRVQAYLSGLDLAEEVAAFRAAAADAAWAPADASALVVDNDLFALLRAGTDEPDAVAVVCGTGINAIGVRADGATVRFPALGMITGDWGGGWHLGEQALWHAARAVDGRGPSTALTAAIPPVFGLSSIDEVIRALHVGDVPSDALSQICPALFACADAGDAVAQALVDRQVEEIAVLATTTLRRLGLLDADVPVVLGGGVIAAGNGRLMDGVRSALSVDAPHVRVVHVESPPVVGAALLALAGADADATALARARDESAR